MTAVGGFVFDPSGNGRPDVTVRLFLDAPVGDRCGGSQTYGVNGYVASYTTGSDGFYFFWQKNLDNTGLATGTEHPRERVQVLHRAVRPDGSGRHGDALRPALLAGPLACRAPSATRSSTKRTSSSAARRASPTRASRRRLATAGRRGPSRSRLLDGFGNVMTVDTGGSSITSGIASGAGGVLTSATSLTKSLVQGTATWTDLKITGASGAYKLGADSSVSGVPDQTSLPINLTP